MNKMHKKYYNNYRKDVEIIFQFEILSKIVVMAVVRIVS